MEILILGGTRFLGLALVEAGLTRGHQLTLFNRGTRVLDDRVENLKGDRDVDLSVLEGRNWDVVIDTCGYFPRIVGKSAEFLKNKVEQYVFISTVSVYRDLSVPVNENSAVGTIENPNIEEITGETYGPLKALCEQRVQGYFSENSLLIRPGFIVGPHDNTDRFTYWPHRVAQGGEVLVPGTPQDLLQIVDVRDLAEWTIQMVEEKQTGLYNAVGPDYSLTMGDLLSSIQEAVTTENSLTWIPHEFLTPTKDPKTTPPIPFYCSPFEVGFEAIHRVDGSRAISTGLTFRPLINTVQDTLGWDQLRPAGQTFKSPFSAKDEAFWLEKWKQN